MRYTYNEVSKEFVGIVEYLDSEWGEEAVYKLKDILKYALECVAFRQDIEERNAIDDYVRTHNG